MTVGNKPSCCPQCMSQRKGRFHASLSRLNLREAARRFGEAVLAGQAHNVRGRPGAKVQEPRVGHDVPVQCKIQQAPAQLRLLINNRVLAPILWRHDLQMRVFLARHDAVPDNNLVQ